MSTARRLLVALLVTGIAPLAGCGERGDRLRFEGVSAEVVRPEGRAGPGLLRVGGRVAGMSGQTEDGEHRVDCVVRLSVTDARGTSVPELTTDELVRFDGVAGVLSRSDAYADAPFSAELPVPARLAPGRYVARLRAVDARSVHEAEARVEIVLP